MICNKIYLSKERNVFIKTYLLDNSQELKPDIRRPLVIICPGGGYSFLSDKESEPIALKYASNGCHAVILNYGIKEHAVMPGPIKDIADTIAYIRNHSEEWFVDANQIYVSGFSAGGHVAASIGVFWNNPQILPEYSSDFSLIKPNGLILGYPVIDLESSSNHLDIGIQPETNINDIVFDQLHPDMPLDKIFIFDNIENRYFVNFENAMNAYILGGEYTKQQEHDYSLQNHITKYTPPAFIWHTAADGLIYPDNSLLFANGLRKHNIPFELHIFENGGHGLGLADNITANSQAEIVEECQPWSDLAIAWLNKRTGIKNLGGQ